MSENSIQAISQTQFNFIKYYQEIFEQVNKDLRSIQSVYLNALEPLQETIRAYNAISIDITQSLKPMLSISEQIRKDFAVIQKQRMEEYLSTTSLMTKALNQQVLRQQQIFSQINQAYLQGIDLNAITEAQKTVKAVFEDLRNQEFKILQQATGFPALTQLSKTIQEISSLSGAKLDYSFLRELASTLESAPIDFEIDEELINSFELQISNQTNELSPGTINAHGMLEVFMALMTILGILINIASYYDSYQSGRTIEAIEKEQYYINEKLQELISQNQISLEKNSDTNEYLEQIEDGQETVNKNLEKLVLLGQTILPHIEELTPKYQEEEKLLYVVVRVTVLRVEPERRGTIITTLYPNQQLEFIEKRQDWVYVQYFDYNEGIPKMGWVYRRNLKLLK